MCRRYCIIHNILRYQKSKLLFILHLHFQKIFLILCQNNFPAVTCSAITLENGEVTYTTTQVSAEYPLDTVATFSCSSQSKLSGSSSSTCQAFENTGNWNPQIPTCNLSNTNNTVSRNCLLILVIYRILFILPSFFCIL